MAILQVKKAEGFIEKTKGLIGSKSVYPIFFTTRLGIHTFFLKFAIDIVVLNNDGTIVHVRENLQPNRVFFWNPMYKNIIELPAGTIKKKNLKVGEKIRLNYKC